MSTLVEDTSDCPLFWHNTSGYLDVIASPDLAALEQKSRGGALPKVTEAFLTLHKTLRFEPG